jgi:hypothetical protein
MEELKLRLDFLHELKIEVLLFVDDTLTEMQNLQIFKSVHCTSNEQNVLPIYDRNKQILDFNHTNRNFQILNLNLKFSNTCNMHILYVMSGKSLWIVLT